MAAPVFRLKIVEISKKIRALKRMGNSKSYANVNRIRLSDTRANCLLSVNVHTGGQINSDHTSILFVSSLTFKRFEKEAGLDILEGLIRHGARLEILEMINYFIYFHHLMDTQRDRFEWIIFSRILIVYHLNDVLKIYPFW